LAIVKHDYFYAGTSDFSSLNRAEDVQATLESELTTGQSTIDTTLAVLIDHGVEDCEQKDQSIVCFTPTPTTILDWKNPSIRPAYLMIREDYILAFYFDNGRLDYLRVRYTSVGP
jgi:hypothetical protein